MSPSLESRVSGMVSGVSGITRYSRLVLQKYLCAVTLAAASVAPYSLRAEQRSEKLCESARDCFDQGEGLYKQGEFQEALPFFQESYKQSSRRKDRAKSLKNIAFVYANLRQPRLALEYTQLYLADNPGERKGAQNILEALPLYAQGLELSKRGNHSAALDIYKKVYAKISRTKNMRVTVLFDIAQSYEQLERWELAAEYYGLYLNDAGAKAPERAALEAKIAAWSKKEQKERRVETMVIVPAPLPIPTPRPPPAAPPEVPPVTPTLSPPIITASPAKVLSTPSPEAVASAFPEKSFFQQHRWSVTSGSLALASLAGGAVMGYRASSKFNELKESCAPGCPEEDINTVAARGNLANGLFIAGGTLAALTAGLYVWESLSTGQRPAESKEASHGRTHQVKILPSGVEVKF